jgi:hypothetical protein
MKSPLTPLKFPLYHQHRDLDINNNNNELVVVVDDEEEKKNGLCR